MSKGAVYILVIVVGLLMLAGFVAVLGRIAYLRGMEQGKATVKPEPTPTPINRLYTVWPLYRSYMRGYRTGCATPPDPTPPATPPTPPTT